MKNKRLSGIRLFFLIFAGILIIATFCVVKLIWLKPFTVAQFYDRALLKYSLTDPMIMSTVALLDPYGLDFYNKELPDLSVKHTLDTLDMMENELKVLRSFNREKQTPEEQLSSEVMEWYIRNMVEARPYILNGFPANIYLGLQKQLPRFMCTSHTINNEQDAKDYIIRLNRFDEYFDQLVALLKEKKAKGYLPPRFAVKESVRDLGLFLNTPAESNTLYTNFYGKVHNLKLEQSKEQELLTSAREAIKNSVYPAYQKLSDYLSELMPKTPDVVGIWHEPKGKEYYAYRVKSVTTADISPQAAFDTLYDEVLSLEKELDRIIQNPPAQDGRVMVRIRSLADLQVIVDEMDKMLDQVVGRRPQAKVLVKFSVTNDDGICQYFPPNLGSSEPATIYLPRSYANAFKKDIQWVLYHEGIPGHHLQLSLAREIQNTPTFRKIIPFEAFSEGWATYAQDIPWTMGLLDDESSLEQVIRTRLFHMGRALLDIGVNAMEWTREEAVSFAVEHRICDSIAANAIVEYATLNPASELSYAMGCLKIEELRNRAQEALKDQFDIREFHDRVLENGSIPLDILDEQIQNYIDSKLEKAK